MLSAWWCRLLQVQQTFLKAATNCFVGIAFLPPALEYWRLSEAAAEIQGRQLPMRFWEQLCLVASAVGVDAGHRVVPVVVAGGPGVLGTRWLPHANCLLAIPLSAIDAAEARWTGLGGGVAHYELPPGLRFEMAHEFAHMLREDSLLGAVLCGTNAALPVVAFSVLRSTFFGLRICKAAASATLLLMASGVASIAVWRRVELRADRTAALSGFLEEGVDHLERRSRSLRSSQQQQSCWGSEPPIVIAWHFPVEVRLAALRAMRPSGTAEHDSEPGFCCKLPDAFTLGFLSCQKAWRTECQTEHCTSGKCKILF